MRTTEIVNQRDFELPVFASGRHEVGPYGMSRTPSTWKALGSWPEPSRFAQQLGNDRSSTWVIVMRESAYPTHTLPPESTPGATPENQKVFYQRLIASGAPFVQWVSFDQL